MQGRMTIVKLAVMLAVLPGCSAARDGGRVRAKRDVSLSASWKGFAAVVVESRNGSVEFAVADVSEVEIDARLTVKGVTLADAEAGLDQMRIDIDPDVDAGRTLAIRLVVPEALKSRSPGARLKIRVPEACQTSVKTSNGSVRVSEAKGEAKVATTNGAVTVTGVDGRVRVDTTNGSVEVRRVTSSAVVDSSNGSVVAETVGGECTLETTNASITLHDVRGNIDADTTNGSIGVDTQPFDGRSITLRTTNAAIELALPAAIQADFDFRTTNAKIAASFGDMPVQVREMSKNRLRASLNDGGGVRVEAHTSNGSIELRFQ